MEMGSVAKSRKKRSSPSASRSEDEEKRSRKHRKRDDKERKSRKDGSKEKKKKIEKSHKPSRSREGKEKKSKEKHKHSKKDMDSEFEELSKNDYYSKNNEFSTWLKEERGIYFSDLSSEAARDLFLSFVKDWNNRKLHSRYYQGISSGPRTAHNWKIKHDK